MRGLMVLLWLVWAMVAGARDRYTVVVSLDGFRSDYPAIYSTPHLDEMARVGVTGDMQSSFPSSTFPNHYAQATGLVPDHNGIVNNTFYDPASGTLYSMGDAAVRDNPMYFLGEPIWLTAQKQGVKAGVVYWVGSDVAVGGKYPTYYRHYNNEPQLPFEERVDSAVAMLRKPKKDRPRLVMLYFSEPDHAGHVYGPRSAETGAAVALADSMVGLLRRRLAELPIAKRINLIVVSDHGMTDISPDRVVRPSDYIKKEWYEVMNGQAPTSIFSREGCRDSIYRALRGVPHINVWKKEEIPAHLNYGSSPRVGDIIVAPDLGWQFIEKPRNAKGAHGFFPEEKDMLPIFRAAGPDFKRGYVSARFINVDLYPLLAHLLGIKPEKTDGVFERISPMLR